MPELRDNRNCIVFTPGRIGEGVTPLTRGSAKKSLFLTITSFTVPISVLAVSRSRFFGLTWGTTIQNLVLLSRPDKAGGEAEVHGWCN